MEVSITEKEKEIELRRKATNVEELKKKHREKMAEALVELPEALDVLQERCETNAKAVLDTEKLQMEMTKSQVSTESNCLIVLMAF